MIYFDKDVLWNAEIIAITMGIISINLYQMKRDEEIEDEKENEGSEYPQ